LIDEMDNSEVLEFPVQASLMRPLFQADSEMARAAFLPLWAGQAAPLIRDLPAAKFVDALVAEAQQRLPSRQP
jgi:nitronate monooxygenase